MKRETLKTNKAKLESLLLDGEVFKPYNGNEYVDKNRFYVSNLARCWDMEKGRFIHDSDNPKYEYAVWFCTSTDKDRDYKSKVVRIHRAVAELFVPIPARLKGQRLVVDHINEVKKDNRAENLRWATYSENANAQDVQQRKAASQKRASEEKKRALVYADIAAENRDMAARIEELTRLNAEATTRVEEAEKKALEATTRIKELEAQLEREKEGKKILENRCEDLQNEIWEVGFEKSKLYFDNVSQKLKSRNSTTTSMRHEWTFFTSQTERNVLKRNVRSLRRRLWRMPPTGLFMPSTRHITKTTSSPPLRICQHHRPLRA